SVREAQHLLARRPQDVVREPLRGLPADPRQPLELVDEALEGLGVELHPSPPRLQRRSPRPPPIPPVTFSISSLLSFLDFVRPWETAARIRSSSISIPSGVGRTASGLRVTFKSSCCPFMWTRTSSPPALASTTRFFRSAWT